MSKKILVIDDETSIRQALQLALERDDVQVRLASSITKGLEEIYKNSFDLIILDLRVGTENGIDLVRRLKNDNIDIPIILISGNATLKEAADAVKEGVYDFIEKPFSSAKINSVVRRCFDYESLKKKLSGQSYQNEFSIFDSLNEYQLVLKKILNQFAQDKIICLTGTKDDLIHEFVKYVHYKSIQKHNNLLNVDGLYLNDNQIDDLGNQSDNSRFDQMFVEASEGIFIFYNFDSVTPEKQDFILNIISNIYISHKIKFIITTQFDLNTLYAEQNISGETYKCLQAHQIKMPTDYILNNSFQLILNKILEIESWKMGVRVPTLDNDVVTKLKLLEYPNKLYDFYFVAHCLLSLKKDKINLSDIGLLEQKFRPNQKNSFLSLKQYKESIEKDYILKILKYCKGNISKSSQILQIERSYLHKRMSTLGIEKKDILI